MSQLTIYVDDKTLKKIEGAARREKTSISKWAREHLAAAADGSWPDTFIATFGSLRGSDLRRPPQGRFSDDLPRAKL